MEHPEGKRKAKVVWVLGLLGTGVLVGSAVYGLTRSRARALHALQRSRNGNQHDSISQAIRHETQTHTIAEQDRSAALTPYPRRRQRQRQRPAPDAPSSPHPPPQSPGGRFTLRRTHSLDSAHAPTYVWFAQLTLTLPCPLCPLCPQPRPPSLPITTNTTLHYPPPSFSTNPPSLLATTALRAL